MFQDEKLLNKFKMELMEEAMNVDQFYYDYHPIIELNQINVKKIKESNFCSLHYGKVFLYFNKNYYKVAAIFNMYINFKGGRVFSKKIQELFSNNIKEISSHSFLNVIKDVIFIKFNIICRMILI